MNDTQTITSQMQSARDSDVVLTATNLSGGYGTKAIWSDADFTITKGEFIAVLGPNGAGKTTLFKLLLGLSKPVGGTLKVLDAAPRRGNSRIGYVPQRHDVDRDTAIEAREFVKLGLTGTKWGIFGGVKSKNGGSEEADAALKLVNAEDLAHKPLGKMSGGELQRIFLAQALVSNPDVLLLDEPLANLDIRRESNLVNLISNIVKERNVTVLLITHNINPLLPVLDRVLYVANGRVVLGTPEEVLTSDSLTSLFGISVEVLRDSKGRLAIIGIEETGMHDHDHEHTH
jgi:zinc/manganese transport system ATP-binding protein